VSCPRSAAAAWEALLAHRSERGVPPPAGLEEALAHLDSCPSCRQSALRVDPLLLFRGARSLSEPVDTAAFVAAVRAGRRQRRVERRAGPRRPAGVAAARVAGALLLAPSALFRGGESVRPPRSARPAAPVPGLSAHPLIENLDRPGARVYQWGSESVSVVMVVDESFDV
jgi:hypothetical protein